MNTTRQAQNLRQATALLRSAASAYEHGRHETANVKLEEAFALVDNAVAVERGSRTDSRKAPA